MFRLEGRLIVSLVAVGAVMLACGHPTVADSGLVSNLHAQRNGLTRAWFSQAQLDRTRHRVERALLAGDHLFVLTTAGVLHAMDAETGRTAWVARIGDPNYPSLGPAANDQYVAVVNGSTVTVLNRSNGIEVLSHQLGGGAGGGPALTDAYVYVPLFSGKLEAFPLGDQRESTWYYASTGRVFDSPIATADSVAWPTDRGYLYVANPTASGVRYRFESAGQINGDPAVYDGTLFATSSNGYLYAIREQSGQQRWRYSAGSSINRPPVAIAGRLYIATEEPALHCVSAADGSLVWQTPDIAQLVGVSKTRVYGMNRLGDLIVLDSKSGVPLGRMATSVETEAVVNDQSDRLYLVSDTGLVQCLHELGADEPTLHVEAPPAEDEAVEDTDAPATVEPGEPAPDEPADQPEVPNPFGGPANDNPFGGDAPAENPFDF